VYKGQGRILGGLMNRLYKEFLVDGGQFQPPIPSTMQVGKSSKAFQPWLGVD